MLKFPGRPDRAGPAHKLDGARGHDQDARRERDREAAQRTTALIAKLSDRAWTVIESSDSRRGIEHVLVGPGGVFAMLSRKPDGPGARVKDGVLWLRRGDGADARAARPGVSINRDALDASRSLHREIRARTGRGPQVWPVVVLWCEFPQRISTSSEIAFVHGRELLPWLASLPRRLDEAGCTEIAQAVRAIPEQRASTRGVGRRSSTGTRRRPS